MAQAYERGIAKRVWKPVQFNDFATPVLPIKKPLRPGKTVSSLRVRYMGTTQQSWAPQI